jgi:membrane protein implicated in regulation of membrane protease activity
MSRNAILIIGAIILGIIIYVTFVIALIKITLGLILLAIAAAVLYYFWRKLKSKAKEKF